jgi:UDP-N-acetylmuramyl pentapeptide phosphotransferase/UDP-N-acetylglucosamine-1-phosphate transferase
MGIPLAAMAPPMRQIQCQLLWRFGIRERSIAWGRFSQRGGDRSVTKRHHFHHLLSNRGLSAASVLTVSLYLTLLRLVACFLLLSEFLLSLRQICVNAKLDDFMLIA